MEFTQAQITDIFSRIANGKNGYQELLSKALEAIMLAERIAFNSENQDVSNGFRTRSVLSHGGKLELMIPRSRHHNFYPLILALVKEQESDVKALAYELYSSGLTGEQIGGIFDKIYGHEYSKSSISNMMQTAREDIQNWLNRKLDNRYPIVYIDATYWSTRRIDSVSQEAYYTILGVKEDRTREVLAVINHPQEGASNWKEVFKSIKERGVSEISLFVCDGLTGIENAIASEFPQAVVQLCTVHLMRNIQNKVKPTDKEQVSSELKEVLNPENPKDTSQKGHQRFLEFIQKWQKKYPSLKVYQEPRYNLYFNYLNYHVQVRRMIYTTNWIERLNRNYKRVLKMRTSMPSPESVLFLLGSVAIKRKEYDSPVYQFIYEKKLFY